ncbi:hypothetical protein PAPYR_1185 [Paratrimastix pyriformis]|uniref:G-protein coupled receptors family 2 profile 2 domain-containing protein n=1 Tax=Paratrimastix pyriformis TaxID=342808 RepID=A0ABQ8UT63_9EUKA|nr:hypothetical protein PAPYR_1185 [Paratrimastix pyriformis]
MIGYEANDWLTDDQYTILSYVAMVSGGLGAVCSLLNILVFGLDKSGFRKNGGIFFLSTSIATLGTAVSFFPWTYFSPELGCSVQAILLHFFWSASTFWLFSITISLAISSATDISLDSLKRTHFVFQVINWAFPLASTLACYFFSAFGEGDRPFELPWCGIETHFFRLMVIVPPGIFLLVSPLCWWMIKRELHMNSRLVQQASASAATIFVNTFIVLYLVIMLLPLTNEIMLMVNPTPKYSQFIPFLLECLAQSGQGLWIFVFLGLRQFLSTHFRPAETSLLPQASPTPTHTSNPAGANKGSFVGGSFSPPGTPGTNYPADMPSRGSVPIFAGAFLDSSFAVDPTRSFSVQMLDGEESDPEEARSLLGTTPRTPPRTPRTPRTPRSRTPSPPPSPS